MSTKVTLVVLITAVVGSFSPFTDCPNKMSLSFWSVYRIEKMPLPPPPILYYFAMIREYREQINKTNILSDKLKRSKVLYCLCFYVAHKIKVSSNIKEIKKSFITREEVDIVL